MGTVNQFISFKNTDLKRENLVSASGIDTIYIGKKTGKRLKIQELGQGSNICSEMFDALKLLNEEVGKKGGNLHISDLFRTFGQQKVARELYEKGIKKAFVAKPGESFHTSGHAIDISIEQLTFPNIPYEKQLEEFWKLCKPLGFRPIISKPDMSKSERWHFDFPCRTWSKAYDSLPYEVAAKACCLDTGNWDPNEDKEKIKNMFIQSQLIRLGYYEIGNIDGIIGKKTTAVLKMLNLNIVNTNSVIIALKNM